MVKKHTPKALAVAIGATFITSMAASPVVSAGQNPFAMSPLSSGYQVAAKDGSCGGMKKGSKTGSCGGMKGKEAHCGAKKNGESHCGAKKKDMNKGKKEGQCGEGKCGGKK
ncbi:MAG: hypothetical protein V3R65_05685 [Acidiferrobacterales bacterium]